MTVCQDHFSGTGSGPCREVSCPESLRGKDTETHSSRVSKSGQRTTKRGKETLLVVDNPSPFRAPSEGSTSKNLITDSCVKECSPDEGSLVEITL